MAFKMKGSHHYGKNPLKHGKLEDFQYGRKGHNPDTMSAEHEDFHLKQSGESPMRHDLPGGEAHTHGTNKNASFDTDTEESKFSRRDRKTYVRTKKDRKKKSSNYDMIRATTFEEKKPRAKRDTWYRDADNDGTVVSRGLGRIGRKIKKAARNIDLKGAFFFEGGGKARNRSSSAFWYKNCKDK